MSKAWCVTNFSDVVSFSCDWKIVNFSRCMKIHQKIDSASIVIPGTGGLVCTGFNPGGIVSKIQVKDVEKVVEEATLFTITLECEDGQGGAAKVAGWVDVQCDDTSLRGCFGDQSKESFLVKKNLGGGKFGWSFVLEKPIRYFTSSTNQFQDHAGFYHSNKQDSSIEIKLSLSSPGEISKTVFTGPPLKKVDTIELVVNMKSLLLDPKHSDVVLKCQNEQLLCHKAILGTRSAVFERMFDVDMKEATSGVVVIDDVEPDVLKAMVEFIYTGNDVTDLVDDLVKLVYVGDKYELRGLLDFCFQKFNYDDDDNQLVEMLIMADKHSLDKFKDLAMRRIIMDKAKFIKDGDFLSRIEMLQESEAQDTKNETKGGSGNPPFRMLNFSFKI